MAENVYERIMRVITKPPELRSDGELLPLLSWFRKKTEIFKRLKEAQLIDVLKNCRNSRKKRDDVLIKQGEKGDCFYITLSGRISIYIKYAKPQEGDEKSKEEAQSVARPDIDDDSRRCKDRSKLGTYVCSLGVGESFGEMALMADDCIRTATIVADETTDCICVDRDLYNRSIRMSLEREFKEKMTFIQTNPVFSNWAPRYKKQLAMAFQRETLTYETVIKRQGDVVNEIYFIISGEVKLKINPVYHPFQYPTVFVEGVRADIHHYKADDENRYNATPGTPLSLSTPVPMEQTSPRSHGPRSRGPQRMPRSVPVCLLGINEVIGDAEVLYNLRTHMQTAICHSKVDLLVLGLRHFERLIIKRNPQALELMRQSMIIRMQNRKQMGLGLEIPLYDIIVLSAKPKPGHDDDPKKHKKPIGFNLPPRGPLIDHFAPGTVFYRIRQRDRIMAKRSKTMANINPHSKNLNMRPTDSASYAGRTVSIAPPTFEKAKTTLAA